jgi:hypothetical protein
LLLQQCLDVAKTESGRMVLMFDYDYCQGRVSQQPEQLLAIVVDPCPNLFHYLVDLVALGAAIGQRPFSLGVQIQSVFGRGNARVDGYFP